jgi:hypothetical protein
MDYQSLGVPGDVWMTWRHPSSALNLTARKDSDMTAEPHGSDAFDIQEGLRQVLAGRSGRSCAAS